MLVYEKNKKLYGTTTVPSALDEEVRYEDALGNVITLHDLDQYVDDGQGGIVRKSDSLTVNMLVGTEYVVPYRAGKDTSFTVTFNSNGGTGSMASMIAYKDVPFTLPTCSFIAPTGVTKIKFRAWSIDNLEYVAGSQVLVTEDTVVKAIW